MEQFSPVERIEGMWLRHPQAINPVAYCDLSPISILFSWMSQFIHNKEALLPMVSQTLLDFSKLSPLWSNPISRFSWRRFASQSVEKRELQGL